MSSREQWEEVAFQVFEDEDGSIRSGYYPTGEGLVDGTVKVDYVFGNFPIQPGDDRDGQPGLSVMDSHTIAAVEWNSFPDVRDARPVGSRNYMVTAAEYLGGNVYEFTSQNNLKVGDEVRTTNCPGFNGTATVVYADATKFRTENEHDGTTKVTGLRGRVDVLNEYNGQTLEGGGVFYWPALGYCNGVSGEQAKVTHFLNYLRELGVDPDYLKDFTFSGGETEWDSEGEPNWDGCIFYSYIPADILFGETDQGAPIYGSDVDGEIVYGSWSPGNEVDIDGSPEDFAVIVFSNDPRKNNAGWWGF